MLLPNLVIGMGRGNLAWLRSIWMGLGWPGLKWVGLDWAVLRGLDGVALDLVGLGKVRLRCI